MRKYIKSQLKHMLMTMAQANEILEEMIEKGKKQDAVTIMEQQQEAAIQIGESIEASEGDGNAVVEELEAYCEILWQCSQEEDTDKQKEMCGYLKDKCMWIEAMVEENIGVNYDILFLPYKASMWDSLESVWLAAREDPTCNCYVMPIPYFERKSDMSFGKMYYEGDKFPDYVPITPYNSYDIKVKHPEAVFIHNPYDEYNYVTSVHPAFYSSELVKYTNMLVYIPYYICSDDIPEDYCDTPGVLNADKVIVQSELIRQTHLRVWKREFKLTEEAVEQMGLYDKVVALGSPKIDKVIKTSRENISLPKEWEKKIFGDGLKEESL